MKARHIKKARKKIKEPRYYYIRINVLKEKLSSLNTFKKFECSSFFRGCEVAKHNQRIYDKKQPRLARKLNWYLKKINEKPISSCKK